MILSLNLVPSRSSACQASAQPLRHRASPRPAHYAAATKFIPRIQLAQPSIPLQTAAVTQNRWPTFHSRKTEVHVCWVLRYDGTPERDDRYGWFLYVIDHKYPFGLHTLRKIKSRHTGSSTKTIICRGLTVKYSFWGFSACSTRWPSLCDTCHLPSSWQRQWSMSVWSSNMMVHQTGLVDLISLFLYHKFSCSSLNFKVFVACFRFSFDWKADMDILKILCPPMFEVFERY